MVDLKEGLANYKFLCIMAEEYTLSNRFKDLESWCEGFVNFINSNSDKQVSNYEYDNGYLDIEYGNIGVSFYPETLVSNYPVQIMNIPENGDYDCKSWRQDQSAGGYINYDVKTGIISFPVARVS